VSETVFTHTDPRVGRFTLRPVEPRADAPLLHAWLTHPKAAYWLMQEATETEVVGEHTEIARSPSRKALLGLHEGTPAFLTELYDPARSPLADVYDVRPGDAGMHVLVAPTDTPRPGFTRAVFDTVMALLFAEPATRRVVVEPDVTNAAVHARNAAVGFEVVGRVRLPDKEALLSTCTRAQYETAREPA
jgi:hypothetical protein